LYIDGIEINLENMIKARPKTRRVNLEKDLTINNFFHERQRPNIRSTNAYFFVLGFILLVALAFEAGMVVTMASK
jgi:hypothetical protein